MTTQKIMIRRVRVMMRLMRMRMRLMRMRMRLMRMRMRMVMRMRKRKRKRIERSVNQDRGQLRLRDLNYTIANDVIMDEIVGIDGEAEITAKEAEITAEIVGMEGIGKIKITTEIVGMDGIGWTGDVMTVGIEEV
jgi:hypothetical protein